MDRAQMLAYAASMFDAIAAETGVPLEDTAAGLAYQLDAAGAALEDAGSNSSAVAMPLIEYHALRKFRAAAAARPDFDATAARRARNQIYEQIDALIAEAAQRCAAAGAPVTTANSYGLAAINLAYIDDEAAGLAELYA